jgi:hypothetical protein
MLRISAGQAVLALTIATMTTASAQAVSQISIGTSAGQVLLRDTDGSLSYAASTALDNPIGDLAMLNDGSIAVADFVAGRVSLRDAATLEELDATTGFGSDWLADPLVNLAPTASGDLFAAFGSASGQLLQWDSAGSSLSDGGSASRWNPVAFSFPLITPTTIHADPAQGVVEHQGYLHAVACGSSIELIEPVTGLPSLAGPTSVTASSLTAGVGLPDNRFVLAAADGSVQVRNQDLSLVDIITPMIGDDPIAEPVIAVDVTSTGRLAVATANSGLWLYELAAGGFGSSVHLGSAEFYDPINDMIATPDGMVVAITDYEAFLYSGEDLSWEGYRDFYYDLAFDETLTHLAGPLSTRVSGDMDGDRDVDADDIQALYDAFAPDGVEAPYDLDSDGDADIEDVNILVHDIIGTCFGDANLDRSVDEQDLAWVADGWKLNAGTDFYDWSTGDFTGDGNIDEADLAYLADSWKQPCPPAMPPGSVPEPTAVLLLGLGSLVNLRPGRGAKNNPVHRMNRLESGPGMVSNVYAREFHGCVTVRMS